MSPEQLEEHLEEIRRKRGYLLPHHGLMATALPGMLEDYDRTFATRIGWKWDFVLSRLKESGWRYDEDTSLIDFGCGTGIASRRYLHYFPHHLFHLLFFLLYQSVIP